MKRLKLRTMVIDILTTLEFVQKLTQRAGCNYFLYHSAQVQPSIPKDSQLITNLIPRITGSRSLIFTTIDLNKHKRINNQIINP
jgi:hypothetical protein